MKNSFILNIKKFESIKFIENNKKLIQNIRMVNHNPIYLENVFTFKNLPVQQKQRKWTDCCCTIFTALFALVLFILSFVMFTKQNYYRANFPADDKGFTCYNDLHEYPFMFFANPSDLTSGRYCLKECPLAGQQIQCSTNSSANCRPRSSSYDTQREINKIGAFCVPQDPGLRNQIFSSYELGNKLSLTHGYDIVRFALLMGFLIGLLYLALVGCFAAHMTLGIFGLAFAVLIATALYILLRPVYLFQGYVWTVLLAIALIILAVSYILYLVFNRYQIQLASIFMRYSNVFLRQTYAVYFYIPLFLILTFGLLVLIVWQFIAFGTYSLQFQQSDIYYQSTHILPLQVLNVIELVWGLQFLRDAFNFVVSGNAVEWYFREAVDSKHSSRPFGRFITKHWGSVVGGSFLNAFFKIFDSFSDCFKCDPTENFGKCSTMYEKLCCCNYIFELIRTDSYSYINLTGIPYCNAARQCQALCRYSPLIRGNHSCMRVYRNAAHVFVIGLAALLCYILFDHKTNQYGNYDHFWIAAAVVYAAYSTSTYFIDIHQNGAEGIMISYLTEENCEGQQFLQVCPGQLRRDIYNFKTKHFENHPHMI